MRIISGKYRGRKLKEFDIDTTRPTLDRVKESIFNLIQFDVTDSVVLDLFSGTGSLGAECVSRGAKKVYLVDKNEQAIKLIKENTKGMVGEFEIIRADSIEFLNSIKEKFDIVLLDPPFATDLGEKAIDILIKKDMLNAGAIIVFETSETKDLKFNMLGFDVQKKKYGTVAVYKITKV